MVVEFVIGTSGDEFYRHYTVTTKDPDALALVKHCNIELRFGHAGLQYNRDERLAQLKKDIVRAATLHGHEVVFREKEDGSCWACGEPAEPDCLCEECIQRNRTL